MVTILFKTKQSERQIFNADGSMPVVRGYYIPKIMNSHINMNEARNDKKYGSYANSDLFLNMARRAVSEKYGDFIPLDNAHIVKSGFLDTIAIAI